MSYTYSSFQSALASAIEDAEFSLSDIDFQALLPTIIDLAEQRAYRDLDLRRNRAPSRAPLNTPAS